MTRVYSSPMRRYLNGNLDVNIIPLTDNNVDLGSTVEFKDLRIDGKAYIDQLGEDLDLDGKYIWCAEQAASTEANKKYLLLKDSTGNVRRVPCYDDA